ncbi:MAG: hypothetical protein ACRERX_19950, partial [Pseudomonas sp.]
RMSIAENVGTNFHEPIRWPVQPIARDQFVGFAGFPGAWRKDLPAGAISFGTMCLGPIMVTVAEQDRIICQLEREYWIQSFGPPEADGGLRNFGGMSGAPVFINRGLHWEFVGIIRQGSVEFDLISSTLFRRH